MNYKFPRKILDFLYQKLFKINDTPQRIALGLGLGVFAGIIPGTGPLFALFLAFIFRVNRASALLGVLITNTWLSFLAFILASKLGAAIFKVRWELIYHDWLVFLKDFHWLNLFKLPILKIILPVITGYLILAFCFSFLTYLIVLVILSLPILPVKQSKDSPHNVKVKK